MFVNFTDSNAITNKNTHVTGKITKANQNTRDSTARVCDLVPFLT